MPKKNPPVLSIKPIWLFLIKLDIFFVKNEKKINTIKKVNRYEIPLEKNKLSINLLIRLMSFPPKLYDTSNARTQLIKDRDS
jgi:hypothetical protein